MNTFRELDGNRPILTTSSLDQWYEQVRDIPFEQMSAKDLARACRQGLYVQEVLPAVWRKLQSDPLAGGMYDGELAVAVARIPRKFWSSHPGEQRTAQALLSSALLGVEPEFRQEVQSFLAG